MVDGIRKNPAKWTCHAKTVTGDIGEDGEYMTEDVEWWCRDIDQVVEELTGRPDFDGKFDVEPSQAFVDYEATEYVVGESSIARHWNEKQVSGLNAREEAPDTDLVID
jgi:hypothetical protein